MSDNTKIEWTDATWNPVTGCSVVSPGCKHCYAMKLAGTRMRHHVSRQGLTIASDAGPVWNGQVRFNDQWLDHPLRWKRPRRIFVCAHGDLFHEAVPDSWIDRVFDTMARAPWHSYQVLTKRAERMRRYIAGVDAFAFVDFWSEKTIYSKGVPGFPARAPQWPLSNVWLGVSVEDRARVGRIWDLIHTPAAKHFVSFEPLLEDITNLKDVWMPGDTIDGKQPCLDWVIVGGESGTAARPMHPDWPRRLRDIFVPAAVPFFFKQWGAFATTYDRDRDDPDWRFCDVIARQESPGRWLNLAGGHGFHGERVVRVEPVGKKSAGALLDGREWREMPA